METYIAYYRVSTNKQNIGLDAQRTICNNFAGDAIIAEYSEHESGKNCNRPELEKAVAHCLQSGAVLLVAKLDRLTRDLAFGATLRKSGVNFKALDCPELTPLMLGVMLGLAQQEREMISTRTKQALAELKAKGQTLGKVSNFSDEGRKMGAMARRDNAIADENNKKAWALISALMASCTKAEITRKLNEGGFKTPRGHEWTQRGVTNLIDRMSQK